MELGSVRGGLLQFRAALTILIVIGLLSNELVCKGSTAHYPHVVMANRHGRPFFSWSAFGDVLFDVYDSGRDPFVWIILFAYFLVELYVCAWYRLGGVYRPSCY